MKGRKSLRNILFAMTLPFVMSGCGSKYDEFCYDEKIGEEEVKFIHYSIPFHHNQLNVARTDGTKIEYVDKKDNDLKLEYIIVEKNGEWTKYPKNSAFGKEVVEEGQKQFDDYLAKILEIKKVKGLEDIKRKSVKDIKE